MSKLMDSVAKQREELTSAYETLRQSIEAATNLLEKYYQQAYEQLETPSYIVSSATFKQLQLHISQLTQIIINAQNGANLFLITLGEKPQYEWEEIDLEAYLNKYRDKTDIPLRKQQLGENQLYRIKTRCLGAKGLTLLSNSINADEIISDSDILRLKEFNKISRLSVRGSNISQKGLQLLASNGFSNLKEIDISECRLVGDAGVKWLSGYKYVSIKANKLEGITQTGILNLIATSYNLNYLELSQIKHLNYNQLIQQINQLYDTNKLNFKWLQLICNLGTVLFVNKLAYLTHMTSNDNITDREVQILLGDQPLLDGLYFNCCEGLHSSAVQLLVGKCSKLKRLSLKRFFNLTDALLGDLVSSLTKLEQLQLNQCCSLSDKGVIQVANQLQKLKKITLNGCISVTSSSLLYLIEKMPTLRTINLAYCKNITDQVIYKICTCLPNLISLIMTKCEQITNDAVAYLSQTMNNLQTLILNGCEGLNDHSLSLIAMRLRKITRFEIEWCNVSQNCIDFIAQNLNELKILNLNYCPAIYDEAVFSLSKRAVKLRSISLASCDKITSKGFIRLFQSLKKIECLDLRQCIGVNDQAILKLCDSSRGKLTQLDLSWCSMITDNSLLQLSQFQQQLLYVNLNGCAQITDSGVGWLCTSLVQLQHLNLSFCENLTDNSVKQISKNLINLRILYLCELKNLTDNSLSTLSAISNLQELHLSGCTKITSSSLIALLHNLQKLQCLNISGCSNIFAQSLLLLVERMRNLKKFYVGSLQVDDNFLSMIGEYMRKLQVLSLQYCRKITDQGVLCMLHRSAVLLHIDLHNTSLSQKTKKLIFEELGSRSLYVSIK